jgi:thiamine transport system ATP-binding protein
VTLTVEGVTVRYGDAVAVDAVSLAVPDGAIVAVIGASGSGKTSLLRAVAGLEPCTTGTVRWDGEDLAAVPPHRRGFGLMFQDHALFDHLDVAGNVGFGLRMQRTPRGERTARVDAMLDLVGLAGTGDRRVDTLSGGQQQRVALARALAPAPKLLMLDEPLASVDRERRETLAHSLADAIRHTRTATLLVTHDLDEAFTLADDVVILDGGAVRQSGPATDVWHAPATRAVARFLGVATEIVTQVDGGAIPTPWGLVAAGPRATNGAVVVGWRPTDLVVDPDGPVTGTVRATWFRRDHFLVDLDTAHGPMTATASTPLPRGASARVSARLDAAVVLEP